MRNDLSGGRGRNRALRHGKFESVFDQWQNVLYTYVHIPFAQPARAQPWRLQGGSRASLVARLLGSMHPGHARQKPPGFQAEREVYGRNIYL